MKFKVNGYTFRGSNSYFHFCPLPILGGSPSWGSILKERISFHRSKVFPLRVDPILKKNAALSRKANRKSQKLFPFGKMIENHRGVLIHLNVSVHGNAIFKAVLLITSVVIFPALI